MKLKTKLLILFVIVGIMPLIILSYISYDISEKIIIDQIDQQLQKSSKEVQEKINNLFNDEFFKIEKISNNENYLLWAKNYPVKKEKINFLKDIFYLNFDYFIKINPEFKNIIYIDNNNENLINLRNEKLISVSGYFKKSNNIEKYLYFKNNECDKLYFVKSIIFENQFYGWLCFEFDINYIREKLLTVELGKFKTFKITLIENDKIVTETKKNFKLQPLLLKEIPDLKFTPIKINNVDFIVYKNSILNWKSILLVQKQEILQPIFTLRNTAVIITGLAAILSIIIALFASSQFVKPIISLTNSATTIAGGNLNEKIILTGKDEIGILAHNFEIMRETIKQHIEKLDMKVLERTQAITDLLNNAGQGFLTFGKNLKIHKEYSKQCIDFIGRNIEDMNILEILYPDIGADYLKDKSKYDEESDIAVTEELIKDIFESDSKIDVKLTLLPHEIEINKLILTVWYVYLKDYKNSEKTKIMLILTDVTLERTLKEKAKIEEERNNLIIKAALDKAGFIEFINDLNKQINYARDLVMKLENRFDVLDELFRIIHTIKGNSPFYNLKRVAEAAHQMEDIISIFIRHKNIGPKDLQELNNYIDNIIAGLNYHLNSISDFLSANDIFKYSEKIFEIPESKLDSLISLINEKLSETEREIFIEKVKELKKHSIKFILKRYISNAQQIADRLGKKIKVNINNEDFQIDLTYFKPLFDVYVHIIRNAVDHGISTPAERALEKKSACGTISIILEELDKDGKKYFMIETIDDGKGIEIEKIRKRIIEKKLLNEREANKLNEDEVLQYIFYPGISSKDSISDVSGRGIGMEAVKEAVSKLGGEIKVKTQSNIGTSIKIIVPFDKSA